MDTASDGLLPDEDYRMRRFWWLALLPGLCCAVTGYGDAARFSPAEAKDEHPSPVSSVTRSALLRYYNSPRKIADSTKGESRDSSKKDSNPTVKSASAVLLSSPPLPAAAVDKSVPVTVKVIDVEPVKTDAEIMEDLEKAEKSKKILPNLARDVNRLAQKQAMQGDSRSAEELLGRLANLCRDPKVNDQRNLGLALNNLGMLLCRRHKYGRAEPILQGSLVIQQQALGAESPAFAEGINNLATLYYEQLRYKDAAPLFARAMAILSKAPEEHKAQLAKTMNNLAGCYSHMNRLKEAEKMLDEVLELDNQLLKGDHPDLAATLNNLGYVYEVQQRYIKAQPLLQRAMHIAEKTYGANSLELVSYLDNYSYLMNHTSHRPEGKKLKTRANKILEMNGL